MVAKNISQCFTLRSLRFSAVHRDCTKVGNHLKPLNLTSCPTMLTLHCMGLRAQLSTMREQENCKTPLFWLAIETNLHPNLSAIIIIPFVIA